MQFYEHIMKRVKRAGTYSNKHKEEEEEAKLK